MVKKPKIPTETEVDAYVHDGAKRRNIPTAENQGLVPDDDKAVKVLRYPRNPDLDPQLVWRGKDAEDGKPLEVQAPPIYIQEKIHPQGLIDNLRKQSAQRKAETKDNTQFDWFHDFNGLDDPEAKTEFYAHDQNWQNRMILGDSLLVMGSLAEREALRGKVQCIYFDPPYGIKFNSNWQPSTKSRDVKDGKEDSVSREPEVVRAFRDTWKDGINSFLGYLRDRLTLARDLLDQRGSIFLQIGDENVHRVRAVLDEIFGEKNFVSLITFTKTTGHESDTLPNVTDYLLWYCKDFEVLKFRQPYKTKEIGGVGAAEYTLLLSQDGTIRNLSTDEKSGAASIPSGSKVFRLDNLRSQGASPEGSKPYVYNGVEYPCGQNQHWKTSVAGLARLHTH